MTKKKERKKRKKERKKRKERKRKKNEKVRRQFCVQTALFSGWKKKSIEDL